MNKTSSEQSTSAANRSVSKKISRWNQWFHDFRYDISRRFVLFFMMLFYRSRYYGIPNVAIKGGALLIANHQSFLDPPLVGAGVPGSLCYLARKTLFTSGFFGKLLRMYNAIPLDQEGSGFEGIKETIKRLKNGQKVLIFPEGARSWNGKITPFKKGIATLAVRAKVPIIPIAITGAHESWPRTQKWPSLFPDNRGVLRVMYGEPIPHEKAAKMTDDSLNELLEKRVHDLFDQLNEIRPLIR